MSLSKWQCEHPGCTMIAIGKGGAVGLRAIGWYFQPGPTLFCPLHRPDKVPCKQHEADHPCSLCAAEHVVRQLQPKLMGDAEALYYAREVLPILQRQDLDAAVRVADKRPLYTLAHFPEDLQPLCEHDMTEYGGCKNADCPNCSDNLIPEIPLNPPARCAACELCTDGQPCRNAESCPLLWCACHVGDMLRELEGERPAQCCELCPCTGAPDQQACDPCCACHTKASE